jgi:hypothetical protein
MRILGAAAVALLLAGALRAQQPDFRVRFDVPGKPVPVGLLCGVNDLNNASPGVWRAYAEALQPRGGLVRVWLKYNLGQLNAEHFRTCERLQQAGMGVFLTVLGAPGSRADVRADEVLPPADPAAYARQAAADVGRLLAAGAPIRYVEIWNEPDMPKSWGGSDESFAAFFAAAGKALRPLLDPAVRLGGPGMAASSGGGLRHFRLITAACRRAGWRPDFLSWHDYNGFAMDQLHHNTARFLTEMAAADGLGAPELILSEWNYGLPGRDRPLPAVDNHVGAGCFVQMATALAQTPVTHSLFFMLQDGSWDTNEDFSGLGVGAFTVHGAPKSVLAGMRLTRRAAEFPAVPVEPRAGLPVNFSLLATRQGDRGFLLAANVFGKIDVHGRKLVEREGIDLSSVSNMEAVLSRYARGEIPYERTGLPAADKPVWDRIVAAMNAVAREQRLTDRSLSLQLEDAPARVTGAWLIDERHGNPAADADFRAKFRPFERGWFPAAAQLTLQQLRGEGVAEADLRAIEAAFQDKRERIAGVAPEVAERARTIFAAAQERIEQDLPLELLRHPAAAAAPVPAEEWAKLRDGRLDLRLPPSTTVLIELTWAPPGGADAE